MLREREWNRRVKRSHHSKDKNTTFCDDIFTFDIETTSAWINEHGSIIKYRKHRSGEYWNGLHAMSLCYLWQFGINDVVYYGRELREFLDLLDELPKGTKLIIWVHNLAFEFHFLQNIFAEMEVFARTPHRPMKMTALAYPNIEWRCTYMLTRLSLDAWGKSIGIPKLTGTVDYIKIRTPITPLDKAMLDYGERDCIVVYHGVKDYLKRYETQFDIPLTQTGTVRREVKRLLQSDEEYRRWIKKLVPANAKEYKMLQRIFAGGYTHANRLHAGVVQSGEVIEHYDFASHYPTMMCAKKYPMTPWAYIGKKFPKNPDTENNAYIFHLVFTGIRCQTFNTYIQAIKTRCVHMKLDNGRVISADEMEIWITEQDWLIIRETYRWDSMECLGVYRSHKDYLPSKLVAYILQLYSNKTTLKDAKGQEDLYLQSKQYINSIFGMMVTALMQSDILFDNTTKQWGIDRLTEEDVNERLKELRSWSPRENRYFLSYSWGCWVTAYARRALWECMLYAGDRDVLYCDTDSIFTLGHKDFSTYNDRITKELYAACDTLGIDRELTHPKDPKGRERPLGVFSKEDDCLEFMTLGAKRYIERRTDGRLYLTVSGINKDAVYCLKGDIENFRDGFIFDKDFPTVKKQLLTYCYEQPKTTFPDGYISDYKHGICMRPNGYHLHMTDEYKNLIRYESMTKETLPQAFLNHLRGRYTVER